MGDSYDVTRKRIATTDVIKSAPVTSRRPLFTSPRLSAPPHGGTCHVYPSRLTLIQNYTLTSHYTHSPVVAPHRPLAALPSPQSPLYPLPAPTPLPPPHEILSVRPPRFTLFNSSSLPFLAILSNCSSLHAVSYDGGSSAMTERYAGGGSYAR